MGKSRRNRGGVAHRRDPIAKQVKPPSDPELAALRESKILPVINDLKNADPKSRSAAATAIANLIQDTRCRKLLLREQVVHTVLTQTLTDAALESRAAGWGVLQVLAQEEEADFCVHLFRQDILTAIEYATQTVSEKLQSREPAFSKLPKAEQSFTTSIAASLVSLLTALAESGDDLLEAISVNVTVSHLLFTLIAHTSQGEDDGVANLRSDALACLMILCEDNVRLAKKVVDSSCFETMVALKDEVDSDGILACATLHNIFAALDGSKDAPHIPNADDSILIPTLAKAVAAITPGQTGTNGSGWSSPVEQQQLALETLASIGTGLNSAMSGSAPQKEEVTETKDDEDMGEADEPVGSDGEDGEEAEGDDDDEMDADAMETDMEMVTGADGGDDDDENINDLPVLKALLQKAMPEVIRVACIQPADDDGMRLQSHALSALNNIAWSLSLVDISDDHNAGIQKAWAPVGRSLWEQVISPILSTDTADVGLAAQVTGLAWAVSRSLGGKTPLKADEHRKFITLYQATKGLEAQDPEDPFQSLGVKCLGVLGQLAIDPAPTDLNREIGTFLVTVLASLPDTPAADAVEALNQVFDIYSDEGYAYDKQVFWKDNFMSHLEEVLPKARALVKTIDKKSKTELRTRADEAVLNLTRFLAYKKKHKP
ncbi:Putative ARM-like repeat-containing protein [Tolypocladium paradoxum]|uniref:ARM-like repeat-containing protein n=1 Tax=Tolypocladium paradoxum TaxID=94208 RepID=A0A2S4L0G2_9HYPO|nr:Putative ARM-like repeat-containing protein [Tolypocladium paradoxum]